MFASVFLCGETSFGRVATLGAVPVYGVPMYPCTHCHNSLEYRHSPESTRQSTLYESMILLPCIIVVHYFHTNAIPFLSSHYGVL